MIITRIQGGLGNQLFQYAAGRRLALDRKSPLKLDLFWYQANPSRTYGLLHFNICAEEASAEEIALTKGTRRNRIARWLERFKPYYHRSVVYHRNRQFDGNIFRAKSSAYLHGYWQSEKYFQAIAPVLRQELTLHTLPDEQNQAMAYQIGQSNSISLHVRRGDYVSSPQASKVHGVCPIAYYHRAIDTLAALVTDPYFFVFSDDLQWVQENLKTDYPVIYVAHNGTGKDYEDLHLMSLCQHHIIANSTFSWWGAWLGTNPQKIVIAPQKWLNIPDHDSSDLIPVAWIQL